MNKKSTLLILLLALCTLSFAQDNKSESVKQHLQNHFKLYGFVRNYFSYDSRENVAGTGDLFNYLPKDNKWNQTEEEALQSGISREDLNAQPSFRFLTLTTRVGLDIYGYKLSNTRFGGKVEADFYAGLTGVTGVAQFRLRHAYMTLAWDSLQMGENNLAHLNLLMGQTWHPMASDLSDVISLNSGAPFGPFSRTPQVRFDAQLGNIVGLTGAAIWQMQYTSAGPDGASANYIKYSLTPEAYLGLTIMPTENFFFRIGGDMLSIKPRKTGTRIANDGSEVEVKVKDNITTVSPFFYLQYQNEIFSLKFKTIYAQAGEHVNLNGGYAVKKINDDGSWEYTPSRNSSSWICMTIGKKVKGILFAGYVRNLGTKEPIIDAKHYYFSKNSFKEMNQLWRLSPTVLWTWGKFQLGLEYEITSVQYGSGEINLNNGLYQDNLHWVTNHKVQLMTKYNF